MSAPTDVRVASTSSDLATLNWTTDGLNPIDIYRAVGSGSFSLLASVAAGTITYDDITVIATTLYHYKLTDDAGATFSSVVSVVTQSCDTTGAGTTQSTNTPLLPQFTTEKDINPQNLNQMSQQVEATLTQNVINAQPCPSCIVDGAVVLDCSSGCTNFQVIVDQDVNSITLIGCDCGSQRLLADFVIPPNACFSFAGWPPCLDFTGDENSPEVGCISGGTNGRILGLNGMTRGPAVKWKTCELCGGQKTTDAFLQIVCCSPNCVLNCNTNKSVQLRACGGWPHIKGDPGFRKGGYHWDITGEATLNTDNGYAVTVTLIPDGGRTWPVSDHSTAKVKYGLKNIDLFPTTPHTCGGPGGNQITSSANVTKYDCAGNVTSAARSTCVGGILVETTTFTGTGCAGGFPETLSQFGGSSSNSLNGTLAKTISAHIEMSGGDCDPSISVSATVGPVGVPNADVDTGILDIRTTAMIVGGCGGPSQCDDTTPIVVTATDNIGNSVSIALN